MILELFLKLLSRLGAIHWTFGFSEPGVPVIPAASQWMSSVNTTQTGTTTSGSNAITGLTSTAGLSVGQQLTGTGIPNGAYITQITSSTAITINTNATASGSPTITFYPFDANQSNWAGVFSGFAGPTAGAIATDTPDCPFNIPDTQPLAAGTTFVPAPGRGIVTMGAFATSAGGVQYNINGTWTPIPIPYTGNTSAASAGYVMCDGVNVRWNNPGSASVTFVFYRERSSKSTSI